MDLYLFQISTGTQHSNLSKTQFVQTLRQGISFTDWLCWTPGFSSWKKLEACPDLLSWVKHNWTEKEQPPAVPTEYVLSKPIQVQENQAVYADVPAEKVAVIPDETVTARVDINADDPTVVMTAETATTENISVEFEQTTTSAKIPTNMIVNKRKHPRVKGRLRTILTNKAKAFITYSKDISLGGISVEHNIPKEILQGEIEVYISDPSGRKSVVFRCNPIGSDSDASRFTFSKTDDKQLTKLTNWLDELGRGRAS